MKYAVEMASGGMLYIRRFVIISSGIQVILRLLPQQFERLQYWYFFGGGLMKYGVEMV
jgi:hypothetical protein